MQYTKLNAAPCQISAAITTNATTAIGTGSGSSIVGYIVSAAGSAWTMKIYNGNPASGGVQIGGTITLTAGFFTLPPIGAPNGLYIVTAGTTAGNLQICYYK